MDTVYKVTIGDDGTEKWFNEKGEFHRESGPAVIHSDGCKHWYKHGLLHRLDGPAVEYPNGTKLWFKDDNYHRVGGPACEYASGDESWYENGKLHRLDGPAIIHKTSNTRYWFVHGKQYTEKDFQKFICNTPSCDGKIVEIDGVTYKLTKV